MLSRFNIVMIHIDKIVSHTKYLPDNLYHLNYGVKGNIIEINTLFISVLLLFETSKIFLIMVSGSWLDLKSFVPTWMIKLSGLPFSGGLCMSSYLLLVIC